ncbi:MAG: DUF1963 domain-containing protein [Vicinamibacterales bacterium]
MPSCARCRPALPAHAGLIACADVIVSAARPSIRLHATPTTAALPVGASCGRDAVGDLGNLYYWIRHEDLAAVRFDRSWAILQCF